ncbi:MAG: metallophosphoesterase family protein [Polyangiales bacterium]
MRIAHFSDLHILSIDDVPAWRFLNKRLTGWAMLRFHRKSVHRPEAVNAVAEEVRRVGVDHVAITGDLSNLALESEFQEITRFLDVRLGLPAHSVSIVPGNHDLYTHGSVRCRRFESFFGEYLKSDLPHVGVEHHGARWPVVKLRGPAAIIGLSSAVPRLPMVASGYFGDAQLDAFSEALEHPEVKRRTKVILQHHPAHNFDRLFIAKMEGLTDSHKLAHKLGDVERGLILHGHSHHRVRREIATRGGLVDVVCAASASLISDNPDRHAGFNLYEIDDASGDVTRIEAHVLGEDGRFEQREIPRDTSGRREVHSMHTAPR